MIIDSIRYTIRGIDLVKSFEPSRQKKVAKIANALSRDVKDVYEFTRSSSDNRLTFMRKLSKKYNWDKMEYKTAKPEDVLIIDDMVKTVKNPSKVHFSIIHEFGGSMEKLAKLFELTQNKKNRLNFVNRMYTEVFGNYPNVYEDMVPEFLQSRYCEEIVKNFDHYKPYLKLNRENSFVVKMLETMIEKGTYNKDKYENIIKKRKLLREFPDIQNINSRIFTPNVYVERHSKERETVLRSMMKNSFVHRHELVEDEAKELYKIYVSTTEKNYKLRTSIVRAYPEVKEDSQARNPHILQELNKLFETVENDKYARSFVSDNLKYHTGVNSVSDFNKMFEQIPSKDLADFCEEAMEIIRGTNYQKDYISKLQKEIEKLADARNSKKGFGSIRGILGSIEGVLNKISPAKAKSVNLQTAEPVVIAPTPVVEIQKQITSAEDMLRYAPPSVRINGIQVEKTDKQPSLSFIKKLQLKNSVMDLVSKKLGAKTLSDQKIDYNKYATKMRFNMLPEIFSSIAETRKADRLKGKTKSLSSNSDVVELFKLINGKNKKLVNYLLKKRNADGTRMFEVKEIINIIDNAEKNIRHNKITNKDFSSKQVKLYYDNIFEEKIQQFGKIKRQPKLDKKA